jgi:hypothetical protein
MFTGVYLFIGGVICTGVGLGLWLQGKLEATHQNIQLPSAFKEAA